MRNPPSPVSFLIGSFADSKKSQVLDYLNTEKVKASFLLNGRFISSEQSLAQESVRMSENTRLLLLLLTDEQKAQKIIDTVSNTYEFNAYIGEYFCSISPKSLNLETLKYLIYGYHPHEHKQQPIKKEDEDMEKEKYELIVTVVNKGFADKVVFTAKSLGASGATIITALGTGIHETDSFMGVAIQPEKEVVLILVPKAERTATMEAISENAGLATEATGLSFSLPVSHWTGMCHLEPDNYTTLKAEQEASYEIKKKQIAK